MLEQAVATFKYILENYGIQAAFLALVIARDIWRDWCQNKTINVLQQEVREILIPLVEKSTSVIASNTVVVKDTKECLRETRGLLHQVRETLKVALE